MATPETIDRVFAMFHAEYGAIALERMASGVPDEHGADSGVVRAREWWYQRLRRYTDDEVVEAAKDSTKAYPRFPATLPQLEEFCERERVRRSYTPYRLSDQCRRTPSADVMAKLQRLREEAAERVAEAELEAIARGWK